MTFMVSPLRLVTWRTNDLIVKDKVGVRIIYIRRVAVGRRKALVVIITKRVRHCEQGRDLSRITIVIALLNRCVEPGVTQGSAVFDRTHNQGDGCEVRRGLMYFTQALPAPASIHRPAHGGITTNGMHGAPCITHCLIPAMKRIKV